MLGVFLPSTALFVCFFNGVVYDEDDKLDRLKDKNAEKCKIFKI